jgi:hypothetical protein
MDFNEDPEMDKVNGLITLINTLMVCEWQVNTLADNSVAGMERDISPSVPGLYALL